MLSKLLHEGRDLPAPVPVMSPWVDADLGVSEEDVAKAISRQEGRRVLKTHTPADGFPVWEGVTVIAVYRHPLDIFFSLRKHTENTASATNANPMLWPVSESFRHFIEADADLEDFDRDKLATVVCHYEHTVCATQRSDVQTFHYADLLRDGRQAVGRLADAAGIDADAGLIDRVAQATTFDSMKKNAADYVPVGGTGHWKKDENFFDSASSNKWEGVLTSEDLEAYRTRLEELLPDASARAWLEQGDAALKDSAHA